MEDMDQPRAIPRQARYLVLIQSPARVDQDTEVSAVVVDWGLIAFRWHVLIFFVSHLSMSYQDLTEDTEGLGRLLLKSWSNKGSIKNLREGTPFNKSSYSLDPQDFLTPYQVLPNTIS
jgi:hypothetical protein